MGERWMGKSICERSKGVTERSVLKQGETEKEKGVGIYSYMRVTIHQELSCT
jgi:hypothetical protein